MNSILKWVLIILAFLLVILGLFYSQQDHLIDIGNKHGAKGVIVK